MCSGSACMARQLSNLVGKYSQLIVYYEKNIKYGGNKHNRTRSSVFMYTKTPYVTSQGNITAMRYRNDVIRSVFLHIRENLGMMLARDYVSWHVARSTVTYNECTKQRAKTQMACKSLRFKSYRPRVFSQTHVINEYTVPCCRCDTRWLYKVLKRN